MAIASKIKNDNAYIYCIVGDGECNEGQVWEAAMASSAFKLNNLIVFVDYNKMQLDGTLKDILDMGDMEKKWESFGFYTKSVDGHDMEEISKAINKGKKQELPTAIILNTTKGKGVSFIEEAGYKSHSMGLTEEQLNKAIEDLN